MRRAPRLEPFEPGLLTLAVQPNRAVGQRHLVDRAAVVAMQAAPVVGRDVAGVRDRADGADDRGGFAVRMILAVIWGGFFRPSVQTRMAVGQLAVFRSVRNAPAYGSKIVRCAHFIGTCTDVRIKGAGLGWMGVLTRAIGRPSLIEVSLLVALALRQAGRMDRVWE